MLDDYIEDNGLVKMGVNKDNAFYTNKTRSVWKVVHVPTETWKDIPEIVAKAEAGWMILKFSDPLAWLYHGDATKLTEIGDNKIACVIADVPYGINYVTGHRKVSVNSAVRTNERFKEIANDSEFPAKMLRDSFWEMYRVMEPNAAVYIFTRWDVQDKIVSLMKELFDVRNVLTWVKNNWCLAGDTHVLIRQQGVLDYVTLQEVFQKWDSIELFTPNGFKPIQRMVKTNENVNTIHTSGLKIRSSPNHVFPYRYCGSGYRGTPDVHELRAKEISNGSLLWNKMEYPDIDKSLSYEDGWFVGFYLAEGYKIKNSETAIRFITGIKEDEYRKRIASYVNDKGTSWSTIQEHNAATGVHSKTIRQMVLRFVLGDDATNKELDMKQTLNTNADFRRGLLDGYCDGDGTVDNARRRISTSSKILAEQIMVIASTLGIYGSKHPTGISGFGSSNCQTIDLTKDTGSQFWYNGQHLARVTKNNMSSLILPMYDLQIEGGLFCIYHGIVTHNSAGDLEGNYAYQTEMIVYGCKGDHKLIGDRPRNALFFKRVEGRELIHPAQKPIPLLQFIISKSCRQGGVVLDPFSGSFSTTMAAHQMGIYSVGIDLDQKNVDLGIKRLSAPTMFDGENLGQSDHTFEVEFK
jgi:DNA modification methylase